MNPSGPVDRTILLVEDNPDDADLTVRAFARHSPATRVVVAQDGPQALDYLRRTGRWADRQPPDMPAVVVLDLKMPRVDGLELLRMIRGYGPTRYVPVVVVTSSSDPRDVLDSYGHGANSYVRKSVDYAEFAASLRAIGEYWVERNVGVIDPDA
ncbi:MAG: response regulator [Gammaproteobacteria bacterium]